MTLKYHMNYCIIIGMWLSLVEHYVRDVGAAGSNPVTSTKKTLKSFDGDAKAYKKAHKAYFKECYKQLHEQLNVEVNAIVAEMNKAISQEQKNANKDALSK